MEGERKKQTWKVRLKGMQLCFASVYGDMSVLNEAGLSSWKVNTDKQKYFAKGLRCHSAKSWKYTDSAFLQNARGGKRNLVIYMKFE